MYVLLTILHILVCIFLSLVVLLQTGKGQDLASSFGGGSSQTVFGSAGPATALSRATTLSAIIFMMTSLGLAILSTQDRSIMDSAPIPEAPAAVVTPIPAEAPEGDAQPEAPVGQQPAAGQPAPATEPQPAAGTDPSAPPATDQPAAQPPSAPQESVAPATSEQQPSAPEAIPAPQDPAAPAGTEQQQPASTEAIPAPQDPAASEPVPTQPQP
jgi:preprotein translocase subunit SecG